MPPRRSNDSVKRSRRGAAEYRVRLPPEVDVRQLALALAGYLEHRKPDRPTFGTLAEDWLDRIARVCPANEQRHVQHMEPLHLLREGELTKASIERCFAALDRDRGGTLGPATLNKLRSTGRLVVEDAAANGRWSTRNPFLDVAARRVPKKPWPRITADELARALACMRPDRMRECIWQIHAGTRPGEQKALRKSDVDLERGFVTVQRSNARDETKTGRPRELPIPAGARDALVEAIRRSPSEFVFPNSDGTQQRPDLKLSQMLRSALKRAGVVTGYAYSCRRKGCGFHDELPGRLLRCCPRCGMKLWCEGVPKHFTFYGLRHAAATLHREAGADAHAVKTALGWVARDVGDDLYTHMSDARYRAELDKLVIGPKR